MRSKVLLGVAVVAVFLCSYAGKMMVAGRGLQGDTAGQPAAGGAVPRGSFSRIVSLAPSITETLFALGLGEKVVGVTQFCDYPPEAIKIPKIGGYYDPNYEAIVVLHPDLVLLLDEHQEAKKNLSSTGLRVFPVNHRTISGIVDSIDTIGTLCGREKQAIALLSDIQARVARIKRKTADLPHPPAPSPSVERGKRPHVLLSIGRSMGSGSKDACIAGKEGFYDAMIEIAGGENVYSGTAVRFPLISPEGIAKLNPDVIIDLVADIAKVPGGKQALMAEWNELKDVGAVRNGRVCILTGNHLMRPGPRFIQTVEDIAKAIHPEADWEK